MSKTVLKTVLAGALILVAACTARNLPGSPTDVAGTQTSTGETAASAPSAHHNHSYNAADGDKGYIDGWVDGEVVQLYYTKSFFCVEPPDNAATTGCELGADAQTPARPGPIPTIYAIAAVGGITPDPATLSCRANTPCLNHPAMIDASLVGGSATSGPVAHSHILTERRGGWYHTVNIRVRNINSWNQIAEAKTLEKVRELQADPNAGVTADTPTNIYFFIASWR